MAKHKNRLLSVNNLFLSLLTFIFTVSCSKEVGFKETNSLLQTTIDDLVESQLKGDVYVRNTNNKEIMLMQSNNNDSIVNTIVVLAFKGKQNDSIIGLNLNNSGLFYYKDKRSIILHSGKDNNIHFLGLQESGSQEKVESLLNNRKISKRLVGTIYGYGLSVIKGKWDLKLLLKSESDYAFNRIELASLTHPPSNARRSQLLNSEYGPLCDEGGYQQYECEATGREQACSVECGAGYYACCNNEANHCYCRPNPALPLTQCGGINYIGPLDCLAPYACIYINDYFSQCLIP